MMKVRSVFFVIFIGLLGVQAQAQSNERSEWTRFEPENEAFVIDTPIALRREGIEASRGYRKYFGKSSDVYLFVFSDNLKNPVYVATVFRFLKSAGQSKPEIGDPGVQTKLTFIDQFGYWHRVTMFRTKKRVYLAQAISKVKDDPIAARFDASLAERQGVIEEPEDVRSAEERGVGRGDIKIVPLGSAGGSGGRGSQRESGLGPGPIAKPAPGQTSPLKILSKPRPGYTEFARLYGISGTVIVRVMFLESGEIGDVTPTKTLPFGLTEEAIAAARRIRFEPAYTDGVGRSVLRPVEYTFAIY